MSNLGPPSPPGPSGPSGSGAAPGAPAAPRGALSRELSEFLIELSIALHRHAMYPMGHPSLGPAVAAVVSRAEALLEGRGRLSLGVARAQLVIEGVATDPKHPVLRDLASRLHRHHLGAVSVTAGVGTAEMGQMIALLAQEPDRTGGPLGLAPARLPIWPHVRLHALTYEKLELIDDTPADGGGGVRAAQLWVGLARAALAAAEADEGASTEPAVIARAIDEHPRTGAYDQVIVAHLLQIADELKSAGGAEALALRRRTAHLIASLKADTLQRLLEMGGDAVQRHRFVWDAADGMAVDAVLEILKAAAAVSQRAISQPLLRMLAKLAATATSSEAGSPRGEADAALRDQVRRLVDGWTLDDPTPDAYHSALRAVPGGGGGRGARPRVRPAEARELPEARRLLQMGLELETADPPVVRAARAYADQAGLTALLDELDGAGTDVARALGVHVATPDRLVDILAREPVDFAAADRLIGRLGLGSAEPMLAALAASQSRSTRSGLLSRLVALGSDVGPLVLPRLADERWYVVRNMLMILLELPAWPDGFGPDAYATHPDARVRLAALRNELRAVGDLREAGICRALEDADERVQRTALAAALERCPRAAVPTLMTVARAPAAPAEIRALAIRVLGTVRDPGVRDALLALCADKVSWFGRRVLLPRSPEMLAALGALAAGWRRDALVMPWLRAAARSRHRDVRAAVAEGAAR